MSCYLEIDRLVTDYRNFFLYNNIIKFMSVSFIIELRSKTVNSKNITNNIIGKQSL